MPAKGKENLLPSLDSRDRINKKPTVKKAEIKKGSSQFINEKSRSMKEKPPSVFKLIWSPVPAKKDLKFTGK